MRWLLRAFCAAIVAVEQSGYAQRLSTYPSNGPVDRRTRPYAIVNALVINSGGDTIPQATILLRNGIIERVGRNLPVPAGYTVVDVKGRPVYPGFIDLWGKCGISQVKKRQLRQREGPKMYPDSNWTFGWNEAVRPWQDAAEEFVPDSECARQWRGAGFTVQLLHTEDGIVRGSGALILLGDGRAGELVLAAPVGSFYSLDKGTSTQDYPTSKMGAVALLRQSLYDASWWAQAWNKAPQKIAYDASLQRLALLHKLTSFVVLSHKLELFAFEGVAEEFGWVPVYLLSGTEYQLASYLRSGHGKVWRMVVPLSFPQPPDVTDPLEARWVSWAQMRHWEMAPAAAKLLMEAGVQVALSAHGVNDADQFMKNLRKAVRYGLTPQAALAALTTVPASFVGMEKWLGRIAEGYIANLVVASSDLFTDRYAAVVQVWVAGVPYPSAEVMDVRGKYKLTAGKHTFELEVRDSYSKPTVKLYMPDGTTHSVRFQWMGRNVSLYVHVQDTLELALSGVVKGDTLWLGQGWLNRQKVNWEAVRFAWHQPQSDTASYPQFTIDSVPVPFNGWGHVWRGGRSRSWLIRNATVWTCSDKGVLEGVDVLVVDGKIKAIGRGLEAPPSTTIMDATGKHLTPGIIDEHSHIAIYGGVNEAGWAISAEVRIADVVNHEDINIFRQVAGGVTTAHLLHGSANPIGGQTAIIKMRWGAFAPQMIFEGAPPFIKFALGENVKQSNWGDRYTIRYPQTRMGVEQLIYDAFVHTKEYIREWEEWRRQPLKKKKSENPPRKNLRWDALAEILQGKRHITCHSYVQSEITMLIRLAERVGFRVNTFTHGLEAYKVAEKIRAHGAGVSTFSDWWSYKYEVIEASAYNAALCERVGITTAINSDDAEMARRLNQEAAKAILYGELTPQEALKLVTINPARLLHIDHRTGSIEVGKDADLVLWSDTPLSVYARPLKTWVEGQLVWDADSVEVWWELLQGERHRLMAKILKAIEKGEKPQTEKPQGYHRDERENYSCEPRH